jgi:hypothetical protein
MHNGSIPVSNVKLFSEQSRHTSHSLDFYVKENLASAKPSGEGNCLVAPISCLRFLLLRILILNDNDSQYRCQLLFIEKNLHFHLTSIRGIIYDQVVDNDYHY